MVFQLLVWCIILYFSVCYVNFCPTEHTLWKKKLRKWLLLWGRKAYCNHIPFLLQLLYQKMKYRKKNPSCCPYNIRGNRCWQHFLKDVKYYEGAANRMKSSWMSWLSSEMKKSLRKKAWLDSPPTVQTTSFALFWKYWSTW